MSYSVAITILKTSLQTNTWMSFYTVLHPDRGSPSSSYQIQLSICMTKYNKFCMKIYVRHLVKRLHTPTICTYLDDLFFYLFI